MVSYERITFILRLFIIEVHLKRTHSTSVMIVSLMMGIFICVYVICSDFESSINTSTKTQQQSRKVRNWGADIHLLPPLSFFLVPDAGYHSRQVAVSRQAAHQDEWSMGAGTCPLSGRGELTAHFLSQRRIYRNSIRRCSAYRIHTDLQPLLMHFICPCMNARCFISVSYFWLVTMLQKMMYFHCVLPALLYVKVLFFTC